MAKELAREDELLLENVELKKKLAKYQERMLAMCAEGSALQAAAIMSADKLLEYSVALGHSGHEVDENTHLHIEQLIKKLNDYAIDMKIQVDLNSIFNLFDIPEEWQKMLQRNAHLPRPVEEESEFQNWLNREGGRAVRRCRREWDEKAQENGNLPTSMELQASRRGHVVTAMLALAVARKTKQNGDTIIAEIAERALKNPSGVH